MDARTTRWYSFVVHNAKHSIRSTSILSHMTTVKLSRTVFIRRKIIQRMVVANKSNRSMNDNSFSFFRPRIVKAGVFFFFLWQVTLQPYMAKIWFISLPEEVHWCVNFWCVSLLCKQKLNLKLRVWKYTYFVISKIMNLIICEK